MKKIIVLILFGMAIQLFALEDSEQQRKKAQGEGCATVITFQPVGKDINQINQACLECIKPIDMPIAKTEANLKEMVNFCLNEYKKIKNIK